MRISKKRRTLPIIVFIVLLLTGCSEADIRKDKKTSETPTGYDDGTIEADYICVDGQVYIHTVRSIKKDDIQGDIIKLGEVISQDNYHIPDEDYESANIPIGTPIYRIDDDIYLSYAEGYYSLFEKTLNNGQTIDDTESSSTRD